MKKIMKNKTFLIVILCIISCSIGVYAATTYKASDVVYKASDGTSMNVNDALNDLYNNMNQNTAIIGKYDINSVSTTLYVGDDCDEIYVLISNGLVGGLTGNYSITGIDSGKIATISSSNNKKAQDGVSAGAGSIIYKISNLKENEQPMVKSFTDDTYTIGSFYLLGKKNINLIGKYDITSTSNSMTFEKDYNEVYVFISHGLISGLSGYYTISGVDSTRIMTLGMSNNKKAQGGISAGAGSELYKIKNIKKGETITINSFTSDVYSIGAFYVMG